MSFSFATWNILATSYIRREFYPKTPRQVLDPGWRIPALAQRAASLAVDILCLQEVERSVFAAFEAHLGAVGYEGKYAAKGHNRPDGCAIFFRGAEFSPIGEERIAYADGNGGVDSGHIGQLLTLDQGGRRLAVLNTHLKWYPPQTGPRPVAWRQVQLAIEALTQTTADGRMLCGDFNVTPDSDVVKAVLDAGMDYVHRGCEGIATCNSNRKAKLIDYICFSGPLRATPVLPPPIGDETVLPSLEQPSDHLPLIARFDW